LRTQLGRARRAAAVVQRAVRVLRPAGTVAIGQGAAVRCRARAAAVPGLRGDPAAVVGVAVVPSRAPLAVVRQPGRPLAAGDPGPGPPRGPPPVVGPHLRPARPGRMLQPRAVLVLFHQPPLAGAAVDAGDAAGAAGVVPPRLERTAVAGPVPVAVAGRALCRGYALPGVAPPPPV